MRDFDADVLRAASQLSVLSGRIVRLLETLNQQVSTEHQTSVSAELLGAVQGDLQSARELQKALVEGHFALVRSMLRKQRHDWSMTLGELTDVGGSPDEKPPVSLKNGVDEAAPAQSNLRPALVGQSFTERQRQIIQLVVLGYDNRQIGHSLGIAEQTVKNHLHTIFEKAGVARRIDLAMHAFENDEAALKSFVGSDLPSNQAQTEQLARGATGN
jgi:ATP/maltotriose-dependent transcriptional regulator MalT